MTQILLLIHVVSGCTFAKGWKTRDEALRPKFIEGKGIDANNCIYTTKRLQTDYISLTETMQPFGILCIVP